MENSESILTSIKKLLGIAEDYTHFDVDIATDINTALATLNQIGVGPPDGFAIFGKEETWSDFMGDDKRLNLVKSYVHLKVRLLFDPPLTSALTEAIDRSLKELEWRILLVADEEK